MDPLSQLARTISTFASTANPMILAALLLGLAGATAFYFLMRRGEKEIKQVCVHAYDPSKGNWFFTYLYEISPGIYASRDGEIVAFIPTWATPETVVVKGSEHKCFTIFRVGALWMWGPLKEMFLVAKLSDEERKADSPAELMYYLATEGIVDSRMKIAPNFDIGIVVDGRQLADAISQIYERVIEEAIVDIATLGGRLRDFKEYVRTLLELERTRARSTIMRYLIIGVVVMLILAMIAQFATGG